MAGKRKGTLNNSIPLMTIGPIILCGILAMAVSGIRFKSVMNDKVLSELAEIASGVLITYDKLYPGDYELVKNDNVVAFYKGESELTGNSDILDSYKESTGAEISLFYKDTRMVTTLLDREGERMVGSGANSVVKKEIIDANREGFYTHADINGIFYYVYYRPIVTDTGSLIGMVGVAKACSDIDALIKHSIMPIWIAIGIGVIVGALVSYAFSRSIARDIGQVNESLNRIAKGDLTDNIDMKLVRRGDEIGEIGKNLVRMQKSLHVLVEKDPLTELYNRRLTTKRLQKTINDKINCGMNYCVAIGDIDFFKKVNDTYGHEMGDVVLKEVSKILRKSMVGYGTASRWGGEEFLLIFGDKDMETSYGVLENILNQVRALEIEDRSDYNEQEMFGEFAGKVLENSEQEAGDSSERIKKSQTKRIIRITMTFGIVNGKAEYDKEKVVKAADDLLYYGKEHGRNQIVKEEAESEDSDKADEE